MCTAQDKKIKDLTKELAATQAFMREEMASIKKSFKNFKWMCRTEPYAKKWIP